MTEKDCIEVREFRRRQEIFHEGDIGRCMYVVEDGVVGIIANYGSPKKEKLLTELKAGDCFGEMGMVRGLPRSATAVSLDNFTKVSIITWDTFGKYFKNRPSKIVGIMQQMGGRIEELTADYVDACGAVTTLLEQRDALREENRKLSQALAEAEAQMPDWPAAAGEDREREDKVFRKYIEEYRRYKQKR